MLLIDIVIKNRKIVTPKDILEAGIGIESRKIVTIAKKTKLPKALRVIPNSHKINLSHRKSL